MALDQQDFDMLKNALQMIVNRLDNIEERTQQSEEHLRTLTDGYNTSINDIYKEVASIARTINHSY